MGAKMLRIPAIIIIILSLFINDLFFILTNGLCNGMLHWHVKQRGKRAQDAISKKIQNERL